MKLKNGVAVSISVLTCAAAGAFVAPASAAPSTASGQECVTASFDGHNVSGDTKDIRILTNTVNDGTPPGDTDFIAAGSIMGSAYTMTSLAGTQVSVATPTVTSPFAGTPSTGGLSYHAPNGFYIASATATACKSVVTPPSSGGGNGGGSGGGGGTPGTGAGGTPPPPAHSGASSGATVTKKVPHPATPKVSHVVPVGQQHGGRYDSSWSDTQWAGLSLIGAGLVGIAGLVARRRRSGRA